ncbi:MAG: ribose ABC transporter permease [Rhodospirillales bacterium]
MGLSNVTREQGKSGWLPAGNRATLVVLLLIFGLALAGFLLSDRFGTLRNFSNLFGQAAFLAIIAIGQTLPILSRGIDLSIGSTIAFAAVLTSGLIDNDPDRMLPVTALVLVLGVGVGLVNATASHFLKVHPLIVTLGMAAILRGVMLVYSDTPTGGTPEAYATFAMGRIVHEDGGLAVDIWSGSGLSIAGLFCLLLYAAVYVFLKRTRSGRNIYAVGGDPDAARLSGISVYRTLLVAYGFSGFCAALAGIYLVSQQGVGSPELATKAYELDSITPVVVGGTLLSGGVGGVGGTLLGVVLMAMLGNLLNFLDISAFYQWIVQGSIIIIAVSIYVERRRRE